jgi:hypothetical protein
MRKSVSPYDRFRRLWIVSERDSVLVINIQLPPHQGLQVFVSPIRYLSTASPAK